MFSRWKKYAPFVFPSLFLAFGSPALRAGDPLDPQSHAARVTAAMQLFRQAKYHEAEAAFRTLLDEDEKKRGLDHADTLQDRKNLAIVLGVEGDFLGSENVLHEGIDLETGILGAENKDVLEFREILASTVAREGRNTEAAREFREILTIRERVAGAKAATDLTVARARGNLGSVLVDLGEFTEAEALLRAAQPIFEKSLTDNDSAVLLNRANLCKALIGLRRFPEAEKEQRAIVVTLTNFLTDKHPEVALAQLNLAATLRVEKKLSEALALTERAEVVFAKTMGPDAPKVKEARQIRQQIEEELSKKAAK